MCLWNHRFSMVLWWARTLRADASRSKIQSIIFRFPELSSASTFSGPLTVYDAEARLLHASAVYKTD